jgi:hypothetical protein
MLAFASLACTALPYQEEMQETTVSLAESTEAIEPTATQGIQITDLEKEYLANLCVIEVRDFKDTELRKQACLSVIDTVFTRIKTGILSDGTIRGTLMWNCFEDSEWCQFPAYVVTTAENNSTCGDGLIPEACPYFYDREWAEEAVNSYIFSEIEVTCPGYIYYGIQDFDIPECQIIDESGIFVNFHRSE